MFFFHFENLKMIFFAHLLCVLVRVAIFDYKKTLEKQKKKEEEEVQTKIRCLFVDV